MSSRKTCHPVVNDLTDSSRKPTPPPAVISDLAQQNVNTTFPHFPLSPSGANNGTENCLAQQGEILELSNEPSPIENPAESTRANVALVLEHTSRNIPPLPKPDSGTSPTTCQDTGISLHLLRKPADENRVQNLQSGDQSECLQSETLTQGGQVLDDARNFQPDDQERGSSRPRQEAEDHSAEPCDEPDKLSMDAEGRGCLREAKEVDRGVLNPQSGGEQYLKSGLHSVDLNDQTDVCKLLETLQSNGLLKKYGYKKESPMQLDTEGSTEPAASSTQELPHPCSKCNKAFNRRCELRCVHPFFSSAIA